MITPELRGYYADNIDFTRKWDAKMYLSRFTLININEFDQITLMQQGYLKHILQKPVVSLSKPYRGLARSCKGMLLSLLLVIRKICWQIFLETAVLMSVTLLLLPL